jgi:hypothetical protein
MSVKRDVSESIKKSIAGKQYYKCANTPTAQLNGLEDYKCVLWKNSDGSFDEAGYEIDHKMELSVGGTNDIVNLHALCTCCHRVKTTRFLQGKRDDNKIKLRPAKPIHASDYNPFCITRKFVDKSKDLKKCLQKLSKRQIDFILNFFKIENSMKNICEDITIAHLKKLFRHCHRRGRMSAYCYGDISLNKQLCSFWGPDSSCVAEDHWGSDRCGYCNDGEHMVFGDEDDVCICLFHRDATFSNTTYDDPNLLNDDCLCDGGDKCKLISK